MDSISFFPRHQEFFFSACSQCTVDSWLYVGRYMEYETRRICVLESGKCAYEAAPEIGSDNNQWAGFFAFYTRHPFSIVRHRKFMFKHNEENQVNEFTTILQIFYSQQKKKKKRERKERKKWKRGVDKRKKEELCCIHWWRQQKEKKLIENQLLPFR